MNCFLKFDKIIRRPAGIFIKKYSLLLIFGAMFIGCTPNLPPPDGKIVALDEVIAPDELGFTLTHEHIMSNFGGPASYDPAYDREKLIAQVLPYLRKVRALGVETIFDCTTAYFGRDVKLLKTLADSSGLNLVTNTGYYAAADDRYVPDFAYAETSEQLAKRWIDEFKNGIDGTSIRPGFIKLAFDDGAPSAIDKKLFQAGILTHKATGLTLAVHTGNNPEAAHWQLQALQEAEVHPSAWIWTHANKVETVDPLLEAARNGAWISLDGARGDALEKHVQFLKALKNADYLNRILLSHDGNSFPRGGAIRPYEEILTALLPRLRTEGFTEAEIEQLTVKNPVRAFAILKRLAEVQP